MAETQRIKTLRTSSRARHPWRDLFLSAAFALSGFGGLLAWLLPQAKANALFGRLGGWQASLALFLTALFLSMAVIMFSSMEKRRMTSFRLVSVWLGFFIVIAPWELGCLLLPASHLEDNPFYVFLGSGVVDDNEDQVRFVRPAHLQWRGQSRGDLAMIVDIPDPYAQDILYKTDFEGFRNGRDISRAAAIFIGDSFTEAGNMPEERTFVRRVAQELDISVRNLGRCAYGPSEELIVLKKHGLECQPRCVIWQFSETNDLNDEVKFQNWITMGRPRESTDSRLPAAEAWKRRSPSYRLFKLLRQSESWPYSGTFRDAGGREHSILFSSPPNVNHIPTGHDGWPVMVDALQLGAKLLRENQIELIVLLIPKKIRVMGPHVEFSELSKRHLSSNWDLSSTETLAWHLQQLCQTLEVPFVDATTRLKQRAAAGGLVYLPLDSHLSARGHAVVADLIVEELRGTL